MQTKPDNNNVMAAIVVYFPSNTLRHLVSTLNSCQIDILLVVNGFTKIDDYNFANTKYIINSSNLGVAFAVNQAITVFLRSSFNYLFLFDQDSCPSQFFLNEMLRQYNKFSFDSNVVSMFPDITDRKKRSSDSFKPNFLVSTGSYTNITCVLSYKGITSGSLYTKQSFMTVGMMNSQLFIDAVDHEWFLRAKFLGCKCYKIEGLFLDHSVGSYVLTSFGIQKTYHRSDLRVYYIVRNSCFLLTVPYISLAWKLTELYKTLRRIFAYTFLSDNRLRTLYFCSCAVFDAFSNRLGKTSRFSH